ncbi:hypothetical protein ILYODFUR_033882, partial [Ilyodon furcidens]
LESPEKIKNISPEEPSARGSENNQTGQRMDGKQCVGRDEETKNRRALAGSERCATWDEHGGEKVIKTYRAAADDGVFFIRTKVPGSKEPFLRGKSLEENKMFCPGE